jgi:hypothetical protein
MSWEELYPVVREQAYYAVLRYDPRRADKMQELICQSFEKYQRDIAAGKEIKKQNYKCFVSQRAKSVDERSFAKKGLGGTSTIDVLCFLRRRPDSPTPVVQFDEWMTASVRNKQLVDDALAFNVDYKDWVEQLTSLQKRVLSCLVEGYRASQIAELIHTTAGTVKQVIRQLQELFVEYFVCA